MKALAHTFHDEDGAAEVEVLGCPSSTGLVRVRALDGVVYARHVDRVTPINEAAKKLLAGEHPLDELIRLSQEFGGYKELEEEPAFKHCK